jgi:hypothetical protein
VDFLLHCDKNLNILHNRKLAGVSGAAAAAASASSLPRKSLIESVISDLQISG